MRDLTEREQALLAFERQRWNHEGAKESAIRDIFGCSATRYYQELNHLIDRPEALVEAPQVVNRLRRLRVVRRSQRTSPASAVR